MRERAMLLLKHEQSTNVCDYAPIGRVLCRIDEVAEAKIRRKFEIAYLMAKEEGIAFNKMNSLCQLEERHGVNLGQGYKNDLACSMFVDYIARDMRENLCDILQAANVFSIQMDGATDTANMEEELFLAVYFDPYSEDGSVHVRNKYFV